MCRLGPAFTPLSTWMALDQCFSNFLMLRPFNTTPRVMVTPYTHPGHKMISSLLCNCNFSAVKDKHLICRFLVCDPQRGCDPRALLRACPLSSLSSGVSTSCFTCTKSSCHKEAKDCPLIPWESLPCFLWWVCLGLDGPYGLCCLLGDSHVQEAAAPDTRGETSPSTGEAKRGTACRGLVDLGS